MKRMRHIIGTLILIMLVVLNLTLTSYAYTEEQKQQAKAWLSAHGYSPDMGGANQAYQDYLNGKFDEELGVDVNGDGIPASTEGTTDESSEGTTEESAEDNKEEDGADETKEDSTSDNITKAVNESVAEESENVDKSTTAQGENQPTQETVEAISVEEDGIEAADNEESTLYQTEKKDEYQEAGTVIVLAVMLMLLAGLWLKKSI